MAKVPANPPLDLAARTPIWAQWPRDTPLWQIANTTGPYASAFATLRTVGPLSSARFDPHPDATATASGSEGVLYAASDLPTAVAERFQHARELRRHQPDNPVVYAWFPTRVVHLIDLTDVGALRLGAAHAINSARKDVTRSWARALRSTWPDADGLRYTSAMTGRMCAALWAPARDSFPPAPTFALLVSHPAPTWQRLLRAAAAELGYSYA